MHETCKKVKARKEYICNHCKLPIHVGEIYQVERWLDEEYFKWETLRLHLGCVDAYEVYWNKLYRLYDHWENWHDKVFV